MSEDREFAFNIREHIGVISKYQTGWTKELNLVEWNGNNAKFDIRDWEPSHEHMSRGVTLREEEAKSLLALLIKYFRQKQEEQKTVAQAAERCENPASVAEPASAAELAPAAEPEPSAGPAPVAEPTAESVPLQTEEESF